MEFVNGPAVVVGADSPAVTVGSQRGWLEKIRRVSTRVDLEDPRDGGVDIGRKHR